MRDGKQEEASALAKKEFMGMLDGFLEFRNPLVKPERLINLDLSGGGLSFRLLPWLRLPAQVANARIKELAGK